MAARKTTGTRRSRIALGFRVHLGWAAGVALAGTADAPAVVDRRRLDLHDRSVPESFEPYHKAAEADRKDAKAIVRRGSQAVHRVARRELQSWLRDLGAEGTSLRGSAVLLSSGREVSFESTLASHALVHTAEGNLMREALLEASERCALRAIGLREKSLAAAAAAKLGLSEAKIKRELDALGAGLGAPWRQDQKLAALGAWLVLAGAKAQ